MRYSTPRFALALIVLTLLGVGVTAAAAQTVALGAEYLREGGPDFPAGPGVSVDVAWPVASFMDVRTSFGRMWGEETRMGTTCVGLLYSEEACPQEPVDHKDVLTTGELLAVVYAPRRGGVRAGVGLGIGRYDFDLSRYGHDTGREIRPALHTQDKRTAPVFLATLDVRPDFAGPLGLQLSGRLGWVSFSTCVADAWGVCEDQDIQRFSVSATYALR